MDHYTAALQQAKTDWAQFDDMRVEASRRWKQNDSNNVQTAAQESLWNEILEYTDMASTLAKTIQALKNTIDLLGMP